MYVEPSPLKRTIVRQTKFLWIANFAYDHITRTWTDLNLGRPRPIRLKGRGVPPPLIDTPMPRPSRKHKDDHCRSLKPSTLQKMVKNFDGSSNPHNHVAAYKEVVHRKQVKDTHMQVESFGLMLKGEA